MSAREYIFSFMPYINISKEIHTETKVLQNAHILDKKILKYVNGNYISYKNSLFGLKPGHLVDLACIFVFIHVVPRHFYARKRKCSTTSSYKVDTSKMKAILASLVFLILFSDMNCLLSCKSPRGGAVDW